MRKEETKKRSRREEQEGSKRKETKGKGFFHGKSEEEKKNTIPPMSFKLTPEAKSSRIDPWGGFQAKIGASKIFTESLIPLFPHFFRGFDSFDFFLSKDSDFAKSSRRESKK